MEVDFNRHSIPGE